MMKANTVLINPRWSFKAHSGITNMNAVDQWSDDQINEIWAHLNKRINDNATIFLMISPTKLALGAHLRATRDWGDYKPRTVHSWHISNPRGSGRSLYDDSEYYCVVLRTPRRYFNKDGHQTAPRSKELIEVETKSWEAPSRGFGASYGIEVYNHIETMGHGPFLQVFDRINSQTNAPDHWQTWIPTKW